jgi:hypothetical protein
MRIGQTAATILATMVLAGLLAGCGIQPGRTVMTQGANADPIMGTAPDTAKYMLYTAASPNPTATVRVDAGKPLGFRRADDGHLVGVADSQQFDLPKGTSQAYWKQDTGN